MLKTDLTTAYATQSALIISKKYIERACNTVCISIEFQTTVFQKKARHH